MLAVIFAVLVGGGYLGSTLVREMFGHSDRNQFLIYVDLPAGYNIDTTQDVVQRLTDWLEDDEANPDITGTIAYVGTGGPRFVLVLAPFDPDPHRAFIIATTETGEQVPEAAERVRRFIAESASGSRRPGQNDVDHRPGTRVCGSSALWTGYSAVFTRRARNSQTRVRAMPGTIDVRNNAENTVIKAEVDVDQTQARRVGISSQEIANSLQAHIDGIRATDYREDDQAIPIVLRSQQQERAVGSDFYDIRVNSRSRGSVIVPLSQIASINGAWEYSRISRRNQARVAHRGIQTRNDEGDGVAHRGHT